MAVVRLTSRNNPLLKMIRLVSSEAHWAPANLVIAEGIRVLEDLITSAYIIEAVVISERFGSTERETNLIRTWSSKGITLCRVKPKLFESLSCLRTPQGALALVHVSTVDLEGVEPGPNPLILCGCGIQDPGNLGTLIRTALSAGASLVCTTRGTVSARNPKVIRASAGAFFRLPICEQVGVSEFRDYCNRHSVRPYRTDTRKGTVYSDIDLSSPCAILLGNEGGGMTQEEWSDLPAIFIPMSGGVESLNVGVAGAVILFEASRQRSLVRPFSPGLMDGR